MVSKAWPIKLGKQSLLFTIVQSKQSWAIYLADGKETLAILFKNGKIQVFGIYPETVETEVFRAVSSMVEHLPLKEVVGGSNPPRLTRRLVVVSGSILSVTV